MVGGQLPHVPEILGHVLILCYFTEFDRLGNRLRDRRWRVEDGSVHPWEPRGKSAPPHKIARQKSSKSSI